MTDNRAVLRVVDEFLWSLRREGITIATSQAIDAARAVVEVGFDDPAKVSAALMAVLVQRERDRAIFESAFRSFFLGERRGSLWDRLREQGFSSSELDELRNLVDALAAQDGAGGTLGALLSRSADFDRLLALAAHDPSLQARSQLQVGFFTHRILRETLKVADAHATLGTLHSALADALGAAKADSMMRVLKAELDDLTDTVRDRVRSRFEQRERSRESRRSLEDLPFHALSDQQIEEVRRAVRSFAERLRGGARVRTRRAQRGRIDPPRTLRRAMATGGVPFRLARRNRRRDRPELIVLCDISESVRSVACFMLEFVYVAQELFEKTRSFVFVSDLAEVSKLFAEQPIEFALARAYSGAVLPVTSNSNYGRVLRAFAERHLPTLTRRTTVVILGDGRNNYHDDGADVLDAIRERARAVLWLCPEGRSEWHSGDSAMAKYEPKCTRVFEVRSARDLEEAARIMVTR